MCITTFQVVVKYRYLLPVVLHTSKKRYASNHKCWALTFNVKRDLLFPSNFIYELYIKVKVIC